MGILALLITSCSHRKKNPKKNAQSHPNILFILGDDFTSQAIGAYHSRLQSVVHTPNIDRLRTQGALLTNVFCTNSICTPSRASIMTGQYSNQNGVYGLADSLKKSHETVAKILHRHGYQTAIFGKWHLKTRPQGFDYYDVFPRQGRYRNPIIHDSTHWKKGKEYKGFTTHIYTNQAISWLNHRDANKPFMLMMNYKTTHEPWGYTQRWDTLNQHTHIPEAKSMFNFYPDHTSRTFQGQILENLGRRMTQRPDFYPGPPLSLKGLGKQAKREKIYQTFVKDYIRSGATLDHGVGRILAYLKKHHLKKNTIVIYTSDQGYYLGEHGWFDKRVMYDQALRMPFIVRYPKKIKAGATDTALVIEEDFAPTMLDYAGIKKPKAMQGRSIRSILTTGKTPKDWRTALYYRYWMHQSFRPAHFGIRTNRYMLMFAYGQNLLHTYTSGTAYRDKGANTKPSWDFYDLKKDPHQIHNEYTNPKYQSVINRLKKELLSVKSQAGDTVSIKTHPVMQKIMQKNFPFPIRIENTE